MDDDKLRQLRYKVEQAEKIKASINKIDKILETIKAGDCSSIDFSYHGPSKGMWGQMDDEGEGDYSYGQRIDADILGISEALWKYWFTEPLRQRLKELKAKLEEDYKKFE